MPWPIKIKKITIVSIDQRIKEHYHAETITVLQSVQQDGAVEWQPAHERQPARFRQMLSSIEQARIARQRYAGLGKYKRAGPERLRQPFRLCLPARKRLRKSSNRDHLQRCWQ